MKLFGDQIELHITPKLLRIAIGLLLIEVIGMWWLLSGTLPFAKSSLLTYHAFISFVVAYVVACGALHSSQPQRFSFWATLVFLLMLLVFNPLYPLLLTTVHTITADIIAIVVFGYYAYRL